MSHRIREAMRSTDLTPFGGEGGIVEVDETYIGSKFKATGRNFGVGRKHVVLTLVDRKGSARSFHIKGATKRNVLPILRTNLDQEARVITDGSGLYQKLDEEYMHAFVDHSKGEYGRGEIYTNTVEGFFSIFKRGMRGVYQHCKEKHLHRYLAEFDFRYSNREFTGYNDTDRADALLRGIVGKRLTYETTGRA
jgi:transposase-like protein